MLTYIKTTTLFLLILLGNINETYAQEIGSIQDLFNALKTHPQTKIDELALEKAKTGKGSAYSALYPTLTAYGSYDYSSIPTSMIPVPPNTMFEMIQDESIAQPFSEHIYRAGISISMPIFIKSIYTLGRKATYLLKSAEAKNQINLLQNEAIIVSSNARFSYLDALTNAMEQKKKSLLKTQEIVEMNVHNGRASGASLLLVKNGINQVEASLNEIAIQRENTIATIESLTGIRLKSSLAMFQTDSVNTATMEGLEPLRQKVIADKLGYRAEKEKLLPSMVLKGNYNHSFAKSYNTDTALDENYTTFGLALNIPLFHKSQYTEITKSRISYDETQTALDQLELSLISQANQLKNSLQLIHLSEELYERNVKDKEELLKIAKVSYKSDRISIEDYLKYEDDLVLEKSNLYKARAEKWQTLVKLAVIYGNNIENLVK
ncbi:TolC family protein [Maribacter polysaccharolyticus]|uniref:TolC family protein n=1 Tax=Maribacter polysaccharolyticus TaxID=3020831 RepID=UPI00237F06BC|nr:TolC family protein [Maribacter polysaccharolyticus]MDE3740261.1 TolC family protein [Maribacter polysaccharolyticus]